MYTIYMNIKMYIISLFLCLSLVTAFSSVQNAKAQVVTLPFAGRIAFVMPCANGLYIVVASPDPKSAGPYIITPAVIPRLWGIVLPSYGILGRYLPGMQCIIPPVVIPTKGAVIEFGTSLLPAVF
jgi:hypothetical protein